MGLSSSELSEFELSVRGELTRAIAELGYAPGNGALAARLNATAPAIDAALRRLHDAHALLLHPHRCAPWVVHPFALSPGSCWVEAGERGWWANCLYCGMGILAAIGGDGSIHTRMGGEREPLTVNVRGGDIDRKDLLFHLATPVRYWWDNVMYSCATFQPFATGRDVDAWCERHSLAKGAVVPLPRMWRFSVEWYGGYVRSPWRKRAPHEIAEIFARHNFEGEFWRLA